jgi:hypothetical protein
MAAGPTVGSAQSQGAQFLVDVGSEVVEEAAVMNEAGGLKWFVEVRAQVGGNGCEQDAGAAAACLIDPMPESRVDGGG